MLTRRQRTLLNLAAFAAATARSRRAPTSGRATDRAGNPLEPRQLALLQGEATLREHLPEDTPISTGLHFNHLDDEWLVVVTIHKNGRTIELGRERLGEFPSELMIATAMLAA